VIVKVNNPSVTVATIRSTSPLKNTNGNGGNGGTTSSHLIYKRYKIKNAALTWTIPHNQNTDRYMAVLRDIDGNQFHAHIKTVSTKIIEVHLTTAMTGYVDVIFVTSNSPIIEL